MATKAPVRPKPPSPEDQITVTLSRRQILALETVFNIGIKAAESFSLIPNIGTAEGAMNVIRRAKAG